MLIRSCKALHFGQFCGMVRAAIATVLGQRGTGPAGCGCGAGSASCSPASPPLRWRLLRAPLRLPPQVGAGQDAQPRLHRIPLRVGVLRDVSPGVFLPAVPVSGLPPEGRSGLLLLVSFRMSSLCGSDVGPPCLAAVPVSASCRSPFIDLGHRRLRRRRNRVWPTGRRRKTTRRGYQG